MIQFHENCLLDATYFSKTTFFPNTTLEGENLTEDYFLGNFSSHLIQPTKK